MTERLSNETEEARRLIAENIGRVRARMQAAASRAGRDVREIELAAVAKYHPAWAAQAALDAGVRVIGENHVQEICAKRPELTLAPGQGVHMIGHLQTNKVRLVADKIEMLQSLDSLHLARELQKRLAALGRTLDVLVEINIGGEEAKSGVSPEAAAAFVGSLREFTALRVRGLMAVPPAMPDSQQVRPFFVRMRQLFIDIRRQNNDNKNINILSMGMSNDFEVAIEEGSTMIRVGTAIFGQRNKEAVK